MVITKLKRAAVAPAASAPAKRRGRPSKSCSPLIAFEPIEYQRPIVPSSQCSDANTKHHPGQSSRQPRSVAPKVADSKKSDKANVDRVDAFTSTRSRGSKDPLRDPVDSSVAVTKKSSKKKNDELVELLYLAICQAAEQDRREQKTAARDFDIQDRDRRGSTSGPTSTSSRCRGGLYNFLALGPSSSRRSSSSSATTDANEEKEEEEERVVKEMRRQPTLREFEAIGYPNSLDDKHQEYIPLEFGKRDLPLSIFNEIESTRDWQYQDHQHYQRQPEEMSIASCISSSLSSSLSSSSPLSSFSLMSLDASDVLDVPMSSPTVCYDNTLSVPPTLDAMAAGEAEAAMTTGLDQVYLFQHFPFSSSFPLASPLLLTPTTTTTAASYFQLFSHSDATHDLSFQSLGPLIMGPELVPSFIQTDTLAQCLIADPFPSLIPMPIAIGFSNPPDPSVQFETVSASVPFFESRKNSKYYLDLVAEKLASNASPPSPFQH